MLLAAMEKLLEKIKFNSDGLVPAIAQDASSGDVLMLAWMSRDSIIETIKTGQVCYYSRSRSKLWRKGESSGHVQKLKNLRLDCDGDAMLLLVEQTGPACHTNRRSCFYSELDGDDFKTIMEVIDE